jgi:hypothetical protein
MTHSLNDNPAAPTPGVITAEHVRRAEAALYARRARSDARTRIEVARDWVWTILGVVALLAIVAGIIIAVAVARSVDSATTPAAPTPTCAVGIVVC